MQLIKMKNSGRIGAAGIGAALALAVAAPPAAAGIITDTPPATVTASPSSDLVDGQTVTLSGNFFPYSQPVTVRQCTEDLTVCTTLKVVTASPNGSLSTDTAVMRRIGIVSYDCASGEGACIIDVQYGVGEHATAGLTFKAPK